MTLMAALLALREREQQQPQPEHKPFELTDEQVKAVDEMSEEQQ